MDKIRDCKSVDELKDLLGIRIELSDDEVDKIAGGMKLIGCEIHTEKDCDFFAYKYVKSIQDALGKDAVCDLLKSSPSSASLADDYLSGGLDGLRRHLGTSL